MEPDCWADGICKTPPEGRILGPEWYCTSRAKVHINSIRGFLVHIYRYLTFSNLTFDKCGSLNKTVGQQEAIYCCKYLNFRPEHEVRLRTRRRAEGVGHAGRNGVSGLSPANVVVNHTPVFASAFRFEGSASPLCLIFCFWRNILVIWFLIAESCVQLRVRRCCSQHDDCLHYLPCTGSDSDYDTAKADCWGARLQPSYHSESVNRKTGQKKMVNITGKKLASESGIGPWQSTVEKYLLENRPCQLMRTIYIL